MLIIVLAVALNVALFFGTNKGLDNALKIAMFIMWVQAIISLLIMFTSEAELLKPPTKHFLYRWFIRVLVFCTIFHSAYWGYFWAPSIWFISIFVLIVRKYELDNRKRI